MPCAFFCTQTSKVLWVVNNLALKIQTWGVQIGTEGVSLLSDHLDTDRGMYASPLQLAGLRIPHPFPASLCVHAVWLVHVMRAGAFVSHCMGIVP